MRTVTSIELPENRTGMLRPAGSLCRRELVRFIRQPNRVVGALATPVLFWLFIGAGFGSSFRAPSVEGLASAGPQQNYIQYFFPGTVTMILLFTAIFSTISIIEDRREGFLQSVLVAPVGRMAVVLGKVLGGTVLATGQGTLFLLLAPLVGVHFTLASAALSVLIMLVVSFALTALGFCIAWRMTSTQGFHAIMNLFLMPMWFLSGALFPMTGAWGGMQVVMKLNPLSYGLAGLRRTLYWGDEAAAVGLPGLGVCLFVSFLFAAGMFTLASIIARSRSAADAQ
jgi:ABC-2 type transport system permease protein